MCRILPCCVNGSLSIPSKMCYTPPYYINSILLPVPPKMHHTSPYNITSSLPTPSKMYCIPPYTTSIDNPRYRTKTTKARRREITYIVKAARAYARSRGALTTQTPGRLPTVPYRPQLAQPLRPAPPPSPPLPSPRFASSRLYALGLSTKDGHPWKERGRMDQRKMHILEGVSLVCGTSLLVFVCFVVRAGEVGRWFWSEAGGG